MILYRICTEDKKRRKVAAIVSRFFEAFTVIQCLGYWRGQEEQSLIIEIASGIDDPPNMRERIEALCDEIRDSNNQECVLLQELNACNQVL